MAAGGLKPLYTCGKWQVDLNRREMRAHGTVVPLGGRAFDLVEVLVSANGELVSKDALMEAVWPGLMVEDNTLQVHISAFRKTLGGDRTLLRTSSGRGYRLSGDWTASVSDIVPPAVAPAHTAEVAGNLPLAGPRLIGRGVAEQHLRDLLSAYRAVTLTGPGGIGKTRLALEVARAAAAPYGGDVWLIELAALTDPALVPSAVTAALGVELRGAVISAEAVARAIGNRTLLLVLDNCEHVIDAAARLAETLLRLCPGITLLSTSREALSIDGEYAYRVAPLDVPLADAGDPADSSAVRLFLARTRAMSSDVSPRPEALPVIAAICRRLDGIPLAIEFAAARAAALGVTEVLARLDDRFALLTSGRRTALPRHQTLRATLDWSHALLPEEERRLLRRLAVFAGGFTLAAACRVIDGPESDALDGIASLVGKSLLGLDENAPAGRWRLLETTRAYALEKLREAGEVAAVARRHAAFFRDLMAGDGTPEGEREIDNIRAALDWAFSPGGDPAIGVALTVGAVPLWVRLSLVNECRERVERALSAFDADLTEDPRARMKLNAALGWALMFAVGRTRGTGAAWSTTLALAEQLGDTSYRLRALWGLWVDGLNSGAFHKAADLARAFSGIVAESGDAIDRMMADRMLGTSFHYLGDQIQARYHIDLMLARPETPGADRQSQRFQFDQRVTAHYFQARILWLQGFADQAMRVVEANLAEAGSMGNALSLGSVLGQGACPIALFTGDRIAAERFGQMLLGHAERHALKLWQGWARAFLAAVRVGTPAGLAALRAELTEAAEVRFLPRYLVLIGELARGLGETGETALGLETVDGAIARCEANAERWYLPELLRIRGELMRLGDAGDAAAEAEAHFLRAMALAEEQGALAWALRAALSLARLQGVRGHATLAAVYGRFSEGFDTADLLAARRVLEVQA